jgi:hypothetical protein
VTSSRGRTSWPTESMISRALWAAGSETPWSFGQENAEHEPLRRSSKPLSSCRPVVSGEAEKNVAAAILREEGARRLRYWGALDYRRARPWRPPTVASAETRASLHWIAVRVTTR